MNDKQRRLALMKYLTQVNHYMENELPGNPRLTLSYGEIKHVDTRLHCEIVLDIDQKYLDALAPEK